MVVLVTDMEESEGAMSGKRKGTAYVYHIKHPISWKRDCYVERRRGDLHCHWRHFWSVCARRRCSVRLWREWWSPQLGNVAVLGGVDASLSQEETTCSLSSCFCLAGTHHGLSSTAVIPCGILLNENYTENHLCGQYFVLENPGTKWETPCTCWASHGNHQMSFKNVLKSANTWSAVFWNVSIFFRSVISKFFAHLCISMLPVSWCSKPRNVVLIT